MIKKLVKEYSDTWDITTEEALHLQEILICLTQEAVLRGYMGSEDGLSYKQIVLAILEED